MDYARSKILGAKSPNLVNRNFRELFFGTDLVERGQFSTLHKVILDILPGDVYKLLEKSTADLDIVDSSGRTALSWAAQRGQVEDVEALLQHGAKPDNNDMTQLTPLHFAAAAEIPDAIEPLLRYGAKITQSTRGWTALHYACVLHDDLAYVKPLLIGDINIDERTYVGKTALSLAVLHNHLRVATYLIEAGANLDILDKEGQSPLSLAIRFRCFDCMRLLLQNGAKHKLASNRDDTLLHLVAKFPSLRIIEYLTEIDWGCEDIDAKDSEDLTARDLIQIHNSDPSIARAFQQLLLRLMATRNGSKKIEIEPCDSDSDIEVYEDAIERP